MGALSGLISDKIRALFTDDEILKSPHPDRHASPSVKPVPKKADGTSVSKPDRKLK